MIIPNKKKAVTILLSRMSAGGGSKDTEAKAEETFGQGGAREEVRAVAADVLQAIGEKSVEGLARAFEALLTIGEAEEDGEEGEEG